MSNGPLRSTRYVDRSEVILYSRPARARCRPARRARTLETARIERDGDTVNLALFEVVVVRIRRGLRRRFVREIDNLVDIDVHVLRVRRARLRTARRRALNLCSDIRDRVPRWLLGRTCSGSGSDGGPEVVDAVVEKILFVIAPGRPARLG